MWEVVEVEKDLANSGAQSGSDSSSWLVICQWRAAIFFKVKRVSVMASRL